MTILARRAAALVISCICIGLASLDGAAQGPPAGMPDPSRFPSRPGMPDPGSPGRPPRDPSARTPPAVPVGTGAIRGRVVAADTGHPLRRARVLLRATRGGRQHATMTDADGSFVLDALPADRYELRASKGRYVDAALGARRVGGPGRPFELADGEKMDDVTLTLAIAGVITGRILDDAGEPVTDARVMAMRRIVVDGILRLVPSGGMRTADDMGSFRLYGLAPGRYYLSAVVDGDGLNRFSDETTTKDVTGFAPTYFPNTPIDTDAQPIEVAAGAEIVADITLVPARLATITGVVVDARGRLAKTGMVAARPSGGGFMGPRGMGSIKPDGTFRMTGVAPGEYRLNVMAGFESAEMPRGDMFGPGSVDMPVSVTGSDIADLRIVVTDPLKIPGFVTFDGAPPSGDRTVNISTMPRDGMGMGGGGRGAQSKEDGSFTLDVRPGPASVMVRAPSGWMLKRILYRGREIEDDVDFGEGQPGRLDVILTNQMTIVTGTVTDGSSRPVLDYEMLLMPDTEGRPMSMRRFRFARADPQGRFRIEGVRPGNYLAVAVNELEREQQADPEVLEALRAAGTRVRIGDGQTQSISLPLTTLP